MTAQRAGLLDSVSWRQLTHSVEDSEFFSGWLTLQIEMVGGVVSGIIVFAPPGEERFRPVAVWPAGRTPLPTLMQATEQALARRQGLVRRLEADQSTDATHSLAFPVMGEDRVCGVVALLVRREDDADLQAALRQLQWGSAWLEKHLLQDEVGELRQVVDRAGHVLELAALATDHEQFGVAGNLVLVELCSRFQCDRVSLGRLHGQHIRMLGISHTANFTRRMNLVRALEYAMEEAVDQSREIIYPQNEDTEPAVCRAHAELARLHGTGGSILSIPLVSGDRIFGAMTFEFPEGRELSEYDLDTCSAASGLVGAILDAKWQNDRPLPAKVLGASRQGLGRIFGPGYLGRKLFLLGLLLLVVFFQFAVVPFRVTSDAVLEGEVQRISAAPFDGFIAQANVRAGDEVQQGDVLAQLDDRDLQLELHAWQSRRIQYRTEMQQARAEGDRAAIGVLGAQIEEADAQIGLLEQRIERTRVVAPFDALVVAGDLSQSLGSAVRQGDTLFQLAPQEGYRIVVKVDERDISEMQSGQTGELILSALPDDRFPLRVERVTPVTQAEEGGNFFRVEARLENQGEGLRPGMEGVAKIEVGERKLIWIWTRRLVGWIQLQLWKWMP